MLYVCKSGPFTLSPESTQMECKLDSSNPGGISRHWTMQKELIWSLLLSLTQHRARWTLQPKKSQEKWVISSRAL